MGQLRQPRAQGLIALAGLPRALFPSALIVARGDAAPGRQAGGRAQASHIDAPFGHQQLPTPLVDPGHRVQERDGPREGHRGTPRIWGGSAARLTYGPWRLSGWRIATEGGQAARNLSA